MADTEKTPAQLADEAAPRESIDFVDLAEEKHGVMEYPLRAPEEDPKWAVNTVKVWTVIVSGALLFIFALLILGAIYD